MSIGLLAEFVPVDVVDAAVHHYGRQARRAGGKPPPAAVSYAVVGPALYAEEDYSEVTAKLSRVLTVLGCWDPRRPATASAPAQARVRLGARVVGEVFHRVAQPLGGALVGGVIGRWRAVSLDGMVFDVPDGPENAEEFGYAGRGANRSAFPRVRAVTLVECGTEAVIGAELGPCVGEGAGERTPARRMYGLPTSDPMLVCDAGFYGFDDWCAAADTGAALLWRVGDTVGPPLVEMLPDGSHTSVVFAETVSSEQRADLLDRARAGRRPDPGEARVVRVVEYYVDGRGPDTGKELICLLTTITDHRRASAGRLAEGYHPGWNHEGGNAQIKTGLRGPGKVLRSQSPELVKQEVYGYFLAHYTLIGLAARAAAQAGPDIGGISFAKTLRVARRQIEDDPAAFPP